VTGHPSSFREAKETLARTAAWNGSAQARNPIGRHQVEMAEGLHQREAVQQRAGIASG
jgi:hypothetical protein